MNEATVLISSAGRRGALVEALRGAFKHLGITGRVIATDMTLLSSAGHLADQLIQVPACSDAAFIPRMTEICSEQSVSLLIPTIDTELGTLADNRRLLAECGTRVMISGPETVPLAADKKTSSDWLSGNGFPVPNQYTLDDALSGEHGWPLFFKPLQGSSSIGAERIDTAEALEQAARIHEGVVEELVVGPEYTVDVYVDAHGEVRCAVPRLRISTRAGEVAKGMTVRHEGVETLVRAVAAALPDAYGAITLQVIDGADGPRVIEINPRLGGGYPLAWQAGARFLEAAILESLGQRPPDHLFDWVDGLVMLRYDSAVFVDRSSVGL